MHRLHLRVCGLYLGQRADRVIESDDSGTEGCVVVTSGSCRKDPDGRVQVALHVEKDKFEALGVRRFVASEQVVGGAQVTVGQIPDPGVGQGCGGCDGIPSGFGEDREGLGPAQVRPPVRSARERTWWSWPVHSCDRRPSA